MARAGVIGGRAMTTAVIVGAGLMGRWHAEAAAHAGVRVAAIVDTDAARASVLARHYAGATVCADLDAALARDPAAAVHLCTPLATHAPLALTAVRAGHHVLVEKPLAARLADAETLLREAADASRLVVPVHQFLFQRGALGAADILPSLGALLHIEAEIASTGAEHGTAAPDDVALEILPHALSFAARHCVRPITDATWRCDRTAPGELVVGASVGETRVTVRLSLRGRPPMNAIRFVAERGTITLDLFNGFAVIDRTGTSRVMKPLRPWFAAVRLARVSMTALAGRALRRETAYPGLRELVRRFHAAAATGAPSPIPLAEIGAVARVWDDLRTQLHSAREAAPGGPAR